MPYQKGSIGRELLDVLLKATAVRRWQIIGAHNFSALSLYLRAGFRPLAQMMWTTGDSERLGSLPDTEIELIETQADDPELLNWDAKVSGVSRPQDFEHWAKRENGRCFLLSRNNQAVGYGVGRVDSPSVLQRNSVSLGPIGANAPDALDATTAMIRWAASQRPEVLWQVFIANPTLPLLLDHGLRIDYLASYLSTETDLFDPACYSPSDFVL